MLYSRVLVSLLVVLALSVRSLYAQTFTSSQSFFISANAAAGAPPYPNGIVVSGVPVVYNVAVRLNTCNHTYAADLDVLLVGPDGQTVMLMSDAGGSTDLVNVNVTFRDGASALSESGAISSFTYAPTNFQGTDLMAPNAPPPPHGTALSAFNGGSGNGEWKVFVYDDAGGDGGSIANWSIIFNTPAPSARTTTAFTYQGHLLDAGSLPVTGAVDLRLSLWNNADSPIPSNQLGATLEITDVPVNNGQFSALIDFGDVIFSGFGKWIQIEVAPAGSGAYDVLSPRQPLTLTPSAGTAFRLINPVDPTDVGAFMSGNGWLEVGASATSASSELVVWGNAFKPGGGSWTALSDARVKHDITSMQASLNRLLSLRGVSFLYDPHLAPGERAGRHDGFIAQDVEVVFPEWVDTREDGFKTLTFRGFEALAVESLRELHSVQTLAETRLRGQIEQLQRDAAAKQRQIDQLVERLDRLESIPKSPAHP